MKIVGLGHALPPSQRLVEVQHPNPRQIEAIRLAGYDRFPVSDKPARTLAGRAARAALDDAGVAAEDLAFIVAGQSNIPDYIGIDFACQVGAELGGLTLRTRNIVEGCGSAVSTWFAADRFADELAPTQAGLLVVAQRVSQAHQDRFGLMNAVLSDGAAAAVIVPDMQTKPHRELFQYVGGNEISHSLYVDMMRFERGGGVTPFVMPDHDSRYSPLGRDRIMELYQFEGDALLDFLSERTQRTVRLIRDTVEQAGRCLDNSFTLLHTLEGEAALAGIAKELGIPVFRTNSDLHASLGHMGCVDPLISLDLKRRARRFTPGDCVMMSTIATGMKWACGLFETLPGAV